ncbi:glucosyl-3-phosphoglycerate synthase [Dietzia maris]|uniref:Glucosyl-3-phosphoglycerate synthase n=1 Tax=Dietzia maris TaxID=37915 RepID=A0AAE4R1K5_9ACTN|nr:glucosyl-3-phosphoglycerate synthase [Dietzia maris]MDV6300578.1 glucosyl-3-phosphoglycerate synthase [Dietzia maris]
MLPDTEGWFRRRSLTARDFDAARVAAAKAGRRLSVVLPARDEEATVGAIVTALREHLVEAVPLLDEIVVIDSDSTDDTARVARAAGAEVHAQSEILPEWGSVPGKGEALWKSLAVTTGDVVAFIDADLRDFDPTFAVGLLAPLVLDPSLGFVKGCYDRPLADGTTVLPSGGGRVTELVARPLIDAWWPELAGFVQPLAGEYAATREVLERIPFARGYGVELALLVDVWELVGLDAMAQVDLGTRRHRNSPDDSLARMAAQIQLTALDRLVRGGRVTTTAEPHQRLTTFTRSPAGAYSPTTTRIETGDRPPMCEVRAAG